MRFLVELTTGEGGRVFGAVSAADRPARPFSGWLQLLRLLEDDLDPQDRGEPATGTSDAQETTWDG